MISLKKHVRFFSESTANFFINGLVFRGKLSRSEYFTGFIGVHFFLFLILPFLIGSNLSFFSFLLMALTFFVSLSATCRRIHDAGGRWYIPFLPILFYVSFCFIIYIFYESIESIHFLIFFGIFIVLFTWNAYWLIQPGKKTSNE